MDKKLNIKLLDDRVMVVPKKAEAKTASGMLIPETAKEQQHQGRVVAVGPGTEEHPLTVKVGDEVIYRQHSGMECKFADDTYRVLRESEIIGVLY